MEKQTIADQFTNVYPVSKTLRFELRPVGKTLEYLERDGVMKTDAIRADDYKKVKEIIDRYHKAFIEESICTVTFTESELEEYVEFYEKRTLTESEKKKFDKTKQDLRKKICESFKKNSAYSSLFKKELFKELLKFVKTEEDKKIVESFSKFTTYFTGFHENRKNMYTADEKSTAIAYRSIHQNLPKYLDNIKIYERYLMPVMIEDIKECNKIMASKLQIDSVFEYFTLVGYNKVLSQTQIDVYNTIIGGYTEKDGTKYKGLNECINLYNQKNKTKIPKLNQLFKQILSDRESFSFVAEQFEDDEEVFQAIDTLNIHIQEKILDEKNGLDIKSLFSHMNDFDMNGIFVKNDSTITALSKAVCHDWAVIKNAISMEYDQEHPLGKKKQEKYDEEKKKYLANISAYSIADLNKYLLNSDCNEYTGISVQDYCSGVIIEAADKIAPALEEYNSIDRNMFSGNRKLSKSNKDISSIKKLMDSYKNVQNVLRPFIVGRNISGKDEYFYTELLRMWDDMDVVTMIYNKVRNYVTSKPYSLEKYKLNFHKSTLLDGWDKNKERDNLGVIFLKENNYYLGIMNRNFTKCLDEVPKAVSGNVYKKMKYKLLPNPNQMLPKVFFAKSNIDYFNPDKELLERYKQETHKKGENFNIGDCHNLIDFFKKSIELHSDWKTFNFEFSETSTYEDLSGFYKEVEAQGYSITYTDIDAEYIEQIVSEGKLYLFQIYNKDFSPYSKGTENLHTMYWKAVFDDNNLQNVVYKLNGQAEVFYRKASIRQDQAVIHPANQAIANKDALNEKAESIFAYDLIKDRRFTCDKFQFHVPVTMNFKAPGERKMNNRVNRVIKDAEDMHIIGIDRGERNLLYISVIDMEGNIVEQMSLNEILSYDKKNKMHRSDYHQKLVEREKENKQSRQNWTTIGTIKELKEGYLSQAVHVITELAIKYNAIIVLEDLNFGFKRGRQKFERQVYQKFEKMLIEKLNYLVDKKKDIHENGGLLHAYQLTAPFESFQKLGKQSGILFYVPAWNTSKIDPTTGFVNLFYTKYESIDKSRAFIRNMDNIYYDSATESFAFECDYKKYTYKADQTKTLWTLYSYGQRVDHFRNPEKNNEIDVRYIDLTSAFNELFSKYGIASDSKTLIDDICAVSEKSFYVSFMKLFSMMLQMRNSDEEKGLDQTISPVKNSRNDFFVSGENSKLPLDADANGAYNIAKKGLLLVRKIKDCDDETIDKVKLAISNKEWLKFAQENTL